MGQKRKARYWQPDRYERLLPSELVPYKEHLCTPRWREIRRAALQRDKHRCTSCGKWHRHLEVHHVTYERLGYERLEDVRTLCANCHAIVHWWLAETEQDPSGRTLTG